jgi:Family of unknown function (DUF5990)
MIVAIEIRGTDLPGRRCDPEPGGHPYEDIHVGLARGTETVELMPGDAPSVRWRFETEVREGDDGTFDFRGPFVQGRRGERSLGLRWVTLEDDELTVFRAAKFRLWELDPTLIRRACSTGRLVATVSLTDDEGYPRCATVRPPHVSWSATASS